MPVAIVNSRCQRHSLPWSRVTGRRSSEGNVLILLVVARPTSAAVRLPEQRDEPGLALDQDADGAGFGPTMRSPSQ